jgi:hypothetical protein
MTGTYDPAVVKRGTAGPGPAPEMVTARLEGSGYGNRHGVLPWQDVRGRTQERVVNEKEQEWEETVEEWPVDEWK